MGDHLYEKSATVLNVDVSMPHKRCRRLKDHKDLVEIESSDPDSEDIFKDNLLSAHYPNRPEELEEVCQNEFVAEYDCGSTDAAGNRRYLLNVDVSMSHKR